MVATAESLCTLRSGRHLPTRNNGSNGGHRRFLVSDSGWKSGFRPTVHYELRGQTGLRGQALRYTKLNPLRARLVSAAELWPWSSAASHCGTRANDGSLALEMWRSHWTATAWLEYLGAAEMESRLAVIRQRTHTGRSLGTAEFIQRLEETAQRRLTLQKRGPHEKIDTDRRQGDLSFDPSQALFSQSTGPV